MQTILLLALTSLAASLGINCRGSALCQYGSDPRHHDAIGLFLALATYRIPICSSHFNCDPFHDTNVYMPGQSIMCLRQGTTFLGGICAFTQGNVSTAGTNGTIIRERIRELHDHGCDLCGSVPLSGNNDPDVGGILTVNYVSGRVCPGLCPPAHYSNDTATA